jgi:hypothetical protein
MQKLEMDAEYSKCDTEQKGWRKEANFAVAGFTLNDFRR